VQRGGGLGKARRRDLVGLAVVAASIAGLILYRYAYLEPRAWGAICAAAGPPLACVPRAGLLWLQQKYALGGGALALGLAAFLWRGPVWLAISAMILGAAAVENYNATWGMVGLALGAWRWAEAATRAPDARGQA
jgi:hypothetical protein